MEHFKIKFISATHYIKTFLKWVVIAGVVGFLGGFVGVVFHKSVELATEIRLENSYSIWFLPLGGLAIVALYKHSRVHENAGTNLIIDSIRSDQEVPLALAPLIFISTVITHLLGGSAGREGAALQLGGSISYKLGRIFHLDEKDMRIITLCGMSAVFAALFGTPLTATIFAMEVISVGVIYYSSFVPCIFSSLVAYGISLFFGAEPVRYVLKTVPQTSIITIIQIVIIAVLSAGVSIAFSVILHKTHTLMEHKWENGYIRILIGSFVLIGLTLLVQSRDYNGAGMDVISQAILGEAKPEAFLLKIIFTAVTIAAGFKGGEIVPTFFIGSTFGCIVAGLIGLNPGFGAAVGLIALFCGVVNSPITSIILSVEIFGAEGLILFAIAVSVTNMLSGYYGLYSSQKIIYSKLKAEFINIHVK
jgi:H+/Cl- antiporter ClcA